MRAAGVEAFRDWLGDERSPTGGSVADVEGCTAINAILMALREPGLIDTQKVGSALI
jgi:hypothetical protein